MKKLHPLPGTCFALLLILVVLVAALPASVARAGGPDSTQDGRINQYPWGNQFGAIAVYCLGANGDNSNTNYKMAIEVLYGAGPDRELIGNTLFWARFNKIDNALTLARSTRQNVEIDRNESKFMYAGTVQIVTWTMWARPDGQFEITTTDSLTGTTQSVIIWNGCNGPKNLSLPPVEE